MSESRQQSLIRLAAAKLGILLFRNNVGVLKDNTGRPVRYGLANDSSSLNRILKSGDLIGLRAVLITQEMVGTRIGQFVSLECKDENWKGINNDREKAQQAWIDLINNNGGYAMFINNPEELNES